jgi:ribosome biogenesis GTPase
MGDGIVSKQPVASAQPVTALVVAKFRSTAEVEYRGERIMCLLKGKRMNVVVGDRVDFQPLTQGQGVINSVMDRATALMRINSAGKPEIVAANVDQLVIVVAKRPTPDWFLVDRYLCAAELLAIRAAIVLNKVDINITTDTRMLDDYRHIGYTTLNTSAATGEGLAALSSRLQRRRSVLLGQSGVGKSSLLNALVPNARERVAALSERSDQGRHTTSTAVLHRLPESGELIDSPGVRDYAPYIEDVRSVARGFREFAPYPDQCRFGNCMHLAEPDCAVKGAVTAGAILARRYESYVRLAQITEELNR